MRIIIRWFTFLLLIIIAIIMVNKGLDLKSLGSDVDGEGMGIYFMGIEINDKASEQNIPYYANGFFVASVITLIIAFIPIWKLIYNLRLNKN